MIYYLHLYGIREISPYLLDQFFINGICEEPIMSAEGHLILKGEAKREDICGRAYDTVTDLVGYFDIIVDKVEFRCSV